MIKELYDVGLANDDYAVISERKDNGLNPHNPYQVELKICFADYESARAFIESVGFMPVKKIIKESED